MGATLERGHVLPDVLAPGLRVIFCGSAAGTASARLGAYYAGPGNRFWEILFRVGLTPRLLRPREFRSLLELGIGLTDLAKHRFGPDQAIRKSDDDPDALAAKIARFRPHALAFVGKRAAQSYLGRARLAYGRQADAMSPSAIFVLPSTSGAARGFWDEAPWHELGDWLHRQAGR